MRSTVATMSLIDGDAHGLVVGQLANWTGVVVRARRDQTEQLAGRGELVGRPVAYLLVDELGEVAHVGTAAAFDGLPDALRARGDWSRVIALSSSELFGGERVMYFVARALERQLRSAGDSAGTWSETEVAEGAQYLRYAWVLLNMFAVARAAGAIVAGDVSDEDSPA